MGDCPGIVKHQEVVLERLQKLIAHSGLTSRRGAEELIRAGKVAVNGQPAHLGQKVDPAEARVTVEGVSLPIAPHLVYYLLNKPPGVVSTSHDPQGRRTVVDLVPQEPRVYPVGRLDEDSEGLLLLTNDGVLTELLTHPRHQVQKTYLVLVRGVPRPADLSKLTRGVQLEDGPARARKARLVQASGDQALVEVVMAEGRKREVRRMLSLVGYPVVRLVRTAVGPLRDRSLASGAWRRLAIGEVRQLYRSAERFVP